MQRISEAPENLEQTQNLDTAQEEAETKEMIALAAQKQNNEELEKLRQEAEEEAKQQKQAELDRVLFETEQ